MSERSLKLHTCTIIRSCVARTYIHYYTVGTCTHIHTPREQQLLGVKVCVERLLDDVEAVIARAKVVQQVLCVTHLPCE